MGNFTEEFPIEVEFLNSTVFPVGHIDRALPVDLDRMGQTELPVTIARLSPLLHPLAFGRVFQYASVAVTIRNKQMSVGCDSNVGSSVDCTAGFGLLSHVDGHQLFAEPRIFDDHGRTSVHGPYVSRGIDADAMRNFVVPLTPRAKELPVGVKNEDPITTVAAPYFVNDAFGLNRQPGNHSGFPIDGGSFNREMDTVKGKRRSCFNARTKGGRRLRLGSPFHLSRVLGKKWKKNKAGKGSQKYVQSAN